MSKKPLNTATLKQIEQHYGHESQAFGLTELNELLLKAEIHIPERSLRRWLNKWIEEGLLSKTGKKSGTRYRLITQSNTKKNNAHIGFLQQIEPAKRKALLAQLRDLWTHSSTAIEGNTLSLGDTHSILELGLTISGKPLREHHEVVGHAKAIDLIYQLCTVENRKPLTKQTIFDLHKAVQLDVVMDIYEPVGEWKVEANYSNSMTSDGKAVIIEYAKPKEINDLMEQLIQAINEYDINTITLENAPVTYAKVHLAFVHIHPFADGNGRLARLIANLPLLKAGLPPLLIDQNKRREYITLLADYQTTIKTPSLDSVTKNGFWPNIEKVTPFAEFCRGCYQETLKLLG